MHLRESALNCQHVHFVEEIGVDAFINSIRSLKRKGSQTLFGSHFGLCSLTSVVQTSITNQNRLWKTIFLSQASLKVQNHPPPANCFEASAWKQPLCDISYIVFQYLLDRCNLDFVPGQRLSIGSDLGKDGGQDLLVLFAACIDRLDRCGWNWKQTKKKEIEVLHTWTRVENIVSNLWCAL